MEFSHDPSHFSSNLSFGNAWVTQFVVWFVAGGKMFRMGPEPSAPSLNRERHTCIHQEEKSAACLRSPPPGAGREGSLNHLASHRSFLGMGGGGWWGHSMCHGGPVPVRSPVVTVWIYWLGGEQTLTGRQQTRTREGGGDGAGRLSCPKGTFPCSSLSGRRLKHQLRV